MCVCVCVCVFVCVVLCMYVHIYIIYIYCIPPLGVSLRAVEFLKASVDVADADIVEHEKRPERGPEL